MKAPKETRRIEETPRLSEPDSSSGTSALLSWIANHTIKRRYFRNKSRSSNLLAEVLLSASLSKVKTDLAKKQEEKRRRLAQFDFSTPTPRLVLPPVPVLKELNQNGPSKNQESPEDEIYDEEFMSCLATIDSFFNKLKNVH